MTAGIRRDASGDRGPVGGRAAIPRVLALAFAGLCSTFTFTLMVPVQALLPALLSASRAQTAWVITITVLVAAVATPIAGRLGDLYGRRRVILVLIATMIAGSIVCALAPDLPVLLIGRAMQGTMAGVIPLSMALLPQLVTRRTMGPGVGAISATFGIGGALGLAVSALVLEGLSWRALFWLSVVVGAVALLLIVIIVPVPQVPDGRRPRFDLLGAVTLIGGLVPLLLAISQGSEWGWGSGVTLVCGLGGAGLLAVWSRTQLRRTDPLVDLRLAARPAVLLTNLASLALGFGLFAANIIYPQLLQSPTRVWPNFGLSPFEASLVVMCSGLVIIVLAPLAGAASVRFGPQRVFVAGSIAVAVSYLFGWAVHDQVWAIMVANILIGIGIALAFASIPLLIIGSVPAVDAGASNGVNSLFRALGTSTCAAVIGSTLATSPVLVDNVEVPTPEAIGASLLAAGLVTIVAVCLGLAIPAGRPAAVPPVVEV